LWKYQETTTAGTFIQHRELRTEYFLTTKQSTPLPITLTRDRLQTRSPVTIVTRDLGPTPQNDVINDHVSVRCREQITGLWYAPTERWYLEDTAFCTGYCFLAWVSASGERFVAIIEQNQIKNTACSVVVNVSWDLLDTTSHETKIIIQQPTNHPIWQLWF